MVASSAARGAWPVRLLVFENDKGEVWTAYTDFDWIARRNGIKNRNDQFKCVERYRVYHVERESEVAIGRKPGSRERRDHGCDRGQDI
jgi:hypothetical protein